MNGAPRIAPVPISSPASLPDRIATMGRSVSGSAVPTAAKTEPTAPSDRPNPSPIHSIPFVNSSAPARITTSEAMSTGHGMRGVIVPASMPGVTRRFLRASPPTCPCAC